MRSLFALIKRDIRLSFARGSGAFVTLFFFFVVASIFPFAMGAEQAVLQKLASGIVWVSVILASLLSLENVYHRDFEDGNFDMLALSAMPDVSIVFAKMCAHWVLSGLLLLVASVVVAQMLFVPSEMLCTLLVSLLLGTVYMSVIGALGAVLTFGTKRPGLLLAVLILPLYVPMLILGAMAVEAGMVGLAVKPYLLLQLAMVVAALPLSVWVSAVLLRMGVRS